MYTYNQLYTYTCGKIFNAMKTSGHSSLENYTSHFIWKGSKGYYCVRGELNRTATDWPLLFWLSQPFFPVLLGCSTGGLGGPSLCWDMVLIPASFLQLTWTSCRRGNIIEPLDSQGRPWSPDIFDRIHLLFTQVHSSFDSLAWSEVNM